MASSWFCRNWTFVASVRFVSWNTSHVLSSVSVLLAELSGDSDFTSKLTKSSVDVDLSSVLVLVMSSVDVEILLVVFPSGELGVWLQSRSMDSLPLNTSSLLNNWLLACEKRRPTSGSLECSLWSESSNINEIIKKIHSYSTSQFSKWPTFGIRKGRRLREILNTEINTNGILWWWSLKGRWLIAMHFRC